MPDESKVEGSKWENYGVSMRVLVTGPDRELPTPATVSDDD